MVKLLLSSKKHLKIFRCSQSSSKQGVLPSRRFFHRGEPMLRCFGCLDGFDVGTFFGGGASEGVLPTFGGLKTGASETRKEKERSREASFHSSSTHPPPKGSLLKVFPRPLGRWARWVALRCFGVSLWDRINPPAASVAAEFSAPRGVSGDGSPNTWKGQTQTIHGTRVR